MFLAEHRKPWPPPHNTEFLVEDFTIPHEIDVDVMAIEFLSVDDPAFLVHYASDSEIHSALSLAGAPVAQGATAAASAAAFRQWVVNFFVTTSANCRVPRQPPRAGFSDCCFQCLSNHEVIGIANRSTAYAAWMLQVSATAGARTGVAYQMTPSPGGSAGGGRSPQGTESRMPLFIIP